MKHESSPTADGDSAGERARTGKLGPLGPPPASGPPKSRKRRLLAARINLYPPFLGAGVRVIRRAPDLASFDVRMDLTRLNKNLVGTHFGGSLYAMCDPFFMWILTEQLGPDYVVWDKAAKIRFWRPGRGTVWARFHIPEDEVDRVEREAESGEPYEPTYKVRVLDDLGKIIAEVDKLLYIKRR
ncbi:MAG: DUF4442 domain-containing protein [Acidobacteriota bacterium]